MKILHSDVAVPRTQNVFYDRPRINDLLGDAIRARIVFVRAGAGYGKTRAVHAFLQKYDAVTTWIQVTRRDNLGARFWENFTNTVSLYNRPFARKLLEISFPGTDAEFEKYQSIPERAIFLNRRHVVVYDDFHLIEDKAVLRFIERCATSSFPNITTIFISRAEPAINMVKLLSRETVADLAENELRFTESEIAEFLRLQGLAVSSQSLRDICADTEGWAFAVDLIGLLLRKNPQRENEARAAMRLNIRKLLESEVFLAIPERLRRFMIRLSLIDHLSADIVRQIAGSPALVEELEQVSSYVRYDAYVNAYQIHHFFLDYLREKQDVLSEDEKRDTYLKAAQWCAENDYRIDAISYYEKIGEYEPIFRIVYDIPLQIPERTAKYLLEVVENAPPESLSRIAIHPAMHLRLMVSLKRFDEAFAMAQRYVKIYEAMPASAFNDRLLSGVQASIGLMRFLTAPTTGVYDFDLYFRKEAEYYIRNPFEITGPTMIQNVGPWLSMVGTDRPGAHEEYIEALARSVPYTSQARNGCLSGMDDLARGELYFFRGDLPMAEKFVIQALVSARKYKQHDIHNRALFYLMRIGFAQGDYDKVEQAAQALETLLDETDYVNRYATYDMVAGWRQLMLGQPHLIADWLKVDFEEDALAGFIADFSNLIRGKYHYVIKNYHGLLAYITVWEEASGEKSRVLFARVILKVAKTLCYYHIKDRPAALATLREAYELSRSNGLIMPFIELGKDMRTLTAAAMRDETVGIPAEWLTLINRKAATYAKRQQIVVAAYRKANNLDGDISLPRRETEVLTDLCQGLSRSEIAVTRNLSINTVKFIINTLYTKLGANSIVDVVRIAMEKKLVH
ncbi:MAG: LuxR C-terminal-related transcriptional regulator [Candidatus Accumulibacter sp.]|jgi:LuxR family maltose regulon positive regulatory protein|nr:LuxR C-terminal-related transcriptional regulator [Accumulibacter sp.]